MNFIRQDYTEIVGPSLVFASEPANTQTDDFTPENNLESFQLSNLGKLILYISEVSNDTNPNGYFPNFSASN